MKKRLIIALLLFLTTLIGVELLNLIGCPQPKIYYVIFQNNNELRPSGGFMGSYAKLKFNYCQINSFTIQDIYVPDGQIQGHVEPPWPINEAFGQGWWKLRDSNWEPDFPTAAKQILWFLEKGGEEKAQGLIAINLIPIKDLLKITGPINLPDYQEQINAQNFVNLIQSYTEKDFFPGSTQKKDILSSLAKQVIIKFKHFTLKQKLQLIKVVLNNLREKQILLSFNNETMKQFSNILGITGSVQKKYKDKNNLISDYLYIVDTNLGANKANFYVEREVNQEVSLDNGWLKDKLTINYKNNSLSDRPQPPDFWGGIYENYLRILIPIEAENIKIKINGSDFKAKMEIKNYKEKKIKSVGFFVIVEPQSQSIVEITYEKKIIQKHPVLCLFLTPSVRYFLEIQKQPGIGIYSHTIQFPAKNIKFEKNIKEDEVLKIKI